MILFHLFFSFNFLLSSWACQHLRRFMSFSNSVLPQSFNGSTQSWCPEGSSASQWKQRCQSLGSLPWSYFQATWLPGLFYTLIFKSPIKRQAVVQALHIPPPTSCIARGSLSDSPGASGRLSALCFAQVILICSWDCHLFSPFPHALSVHLIYFVSFCQCKSEFFSIQLFYFYLEL